MREMIMTQDGRAQQPSEAATEEADLRRDLAAAYRLAAHFGWDDMVGTHFTVRLPHWEGKPESFLINPFGMMFDEITASSLVEVDVEGNILSQSDWPVNRAGFVVHSAIHSQREDAGCVMHLHTDDGVAVATLEDGLLPMNQLSIPIHGKIAYHEYEGPVVDEGERQRMAAALGNRDYMLLRNHGTMTIGATVAEAFHCMYRLERACTWQVRTLSMGLPWHRPSQEVLKEMHENWGLRNANSAHYARNVVWPALLRKLDRICPDYKD